VRVVCISDTHGRHRDLTVPAGDLLIHAGDLTRHGTLDELRDLNAWLGDLPHQHRLVIAGNHDHCCVAAPEVLTAVFSNAHYLCDTSVTVGGLVCFGSPWTDSLGWAFGRSLLSLQYHWSSLPPEIDVLITHGPPLGLGDKERTGTHCGDAGLAGALQRIRPRLHVCGHIHEAYGAYAWEGTTIVNASSCSLRYEIANPPIVIDLP
jgi:Icc-related predicted phosphoesterase